MDRPGEPDGDIRWLRHALALAERAVDLGDAAFGAVLVGGDGAMLVEGMQTAVRTSEWLRHAEMNVLREASWRWNRVELADATLYSSTEPCLMCAGATAWSLSRLVYGLSQTAMNDLYAVSGFPPRFASPWDCRVLLGGTAPPMEVIGPLLEDEAAAAHERWLERWATKTRNVWRSAEHP
jgi:tRNA(Arg) A34 adenosine deaminase TadA